MDMCLCALDLQRHKAYFSGANRPLWIIRKNEQGFEFIEYKGTKASIGIHTPFEQEFENHEIYLEQGDRLFMFTDGVTDQFGGPNGKKLGRNRLKMVLLSCAHMDIQSQKQFLVDFLNDWKGNLEQVDDNLFIGIEIH
jgi:serine phosphatase RsbU (regulator of sigma subunit)